MTESKATHFAALGSLEVHVGDRLLAIGGPRQRLLLAALLVRPGTVVPTDTLVDILWGSTPIDDATTRLAKSVYRLRATFATVGVTDSVTTRAPGYVLRASPDELDFVRFEALLRDAQGRADPRSALDRLDAALALWRGPAWADVADAEFIQPEVARLEDLRAVAVEERADALLALGRHAELVPELEKAIRQYPLRERPHAQLMLALYHSGRQADALSVYGSFRRQLLDEVGLEPSAELRRLQEDILQQHVPGQPATVRGHSPGRPVRNEPAPGDGSLFVGRRRDLAWLEVLFDRATREESPVLAAVTGEPGSGKTSLVRAFARTVESRGGAAHFVRSESDDAESLTMQPADAALESALNDLDTATPTFVVLDCTHADRRALRELAARRAPAPLLAIVTCTTADTELLADLGFEVRSLTGLETEDVARLLSTVSRTPCSVELAESVSAETGGLPGLVVDVSQRLRDLEVAARADRALARAESTKNSLAALHADVAEAVLARPQPSQVASAKHLGACPYKGLAAFGVSDSGYFFGRERLVAEVVARLAVNRFLAVVGPSGSGKSSLVAAGLIPALRWGALPGSENWLCRLIRPGPRPLEALAAALVAPTDGSVPEATQRLANAPEELAAIIRVALHGRPHDARVVVVVDQFEELFTACSDPAERDAFVRALVHGTASTASRMVVALVIRADDYGACAAFPELARMLGREQILIPAMSDRDLHRVVMEPARRSGLAVEDGLVDQVVADAGGAPGALPLVSTALLETWVRRSKDTLTLAGYAESGGVRGAVSNLAESVYDGLDTDGKAVARRIFLRLTDPSLGRTDTRRRAPPDELAGTGADRAVLAELIEGRLLTAAEDGIEIAHEALLREWPRLRDWLQEDRDGRRAHRHLAEAAAGWQTDFRDEGGLYRGARLHAAQEWASSHPGDANLLESEYLAASEAAQDRALHAARRTTRRLRSLAGALAVLLAAAVTAGVLAGVQTSHARHATRLAHARELQADVTQLAGLARTLPPSQHDLALLLGVAGYRIDPSDQTAGGLQAALVQTPPQLDRIIRYPSPTYLPHLDHSGRLLAVGTMNGATVFDLSTGRVVRNLRWPRPRDFAVFSGDDKFVAAGGVDGRIAIWNLVTGRLSGAPLQVGGSISYALFDPTNDSRVYAFTDTGQLTTWDRHDPDHPGQVHGPLAFYGGTASDEPSIATISPDGRFLAAGDPAGGAVTAWDLKTGRTVLSTSSVLGMFGSRDLLPVGTDNYTSLYNVRTGRVISSIPTQYSALGAVLSGNDKRIAVPIVRSDGAVVQVYDVASRRPIGAPLALHGNGAVPVGFLPDGRIVTSDNGEAAIWTLGRSLPPLAVSLPASAGEYNSVLFMPGSDQPVTIGLQTKVLMTDRVSAGAVRAKPLLGGNIDFPLAFDPAGPLVAATDSFVREFGMREIGIWSLRSGRRLALVGQVPDTALVAWRTDGRQLATDFGPAVQLWNVSDPQHPRLTATVKKVSGVPRPDYLIYSPNGRQVITAESADTRVTDIDVRAQHVAWTFQAPDLRLGQVAFSPDSRTVAVDSGDNGKGRITLLDSTSGRATRSAAVASIGGIGYLDGGRWLVATGLAPGPGAQLYDVQTLQPIGIPFPIKSISGVGPIPSALATDRAGAMFAEPENDAPLLWQAAPALWEKIACRIAGRNLTRAEWHQYLPTLPYERTCAKWPAGLSS